MKKRFELGQAPWETNTQSKKKRFELGQAPWEVEQKKPTAFEKLKTGVSDIINSGADKYNESVDRQQSGEQSGLETALQTVGNGLSATGEIALKGAGYLLPGNTEHFLTDPITDTASMIADSKFGKNLAEGVNDLNLSDRAKANINAGVEIGGVIPVGAVISKAGKALGRGVKVATEVAETGVDIAKRAGNSAFKKAADFAGEDIDSILKDAVTPEYNASRAGKMAGAGKLKTKKGTFFDTVEPIDDIKITNAKEAIRDIFDPSASYVDNIENARGAIASEAGQLKSAIQKVDTQIDINDLRDSLRNTELPDTFVNDETMKRSMDSIIEKALKVVEREGNSTSSLLEARKKFDKLAEESFPKLYDGGKPTVEGRAIRSIRSAINDYIEVSLPDDVGFKKSLAKQRALYDAVEGMSSKAGKEYGLGTNRLTRRANRLARKYPRTSGFVKRVAPYVAGTAVGAGGAALLSQ